MDNFDIHHSQFQLLSDRAIDWFIKSLKFKEGSPEREICILKRKLYMRDALKELRKAIKCLQKI